MWPKNDNSRIVARRVRPNVGKIEIERYECAAFVLTVSRNFGVGAAIQLFVINGLYVVSRRREDRNCLMGQILVDLEHH